MKRKGRESIAGPVVALEAHSADRNHEITVVVLVRGQSLAGLQTFSRWFQRTFLLSRSNTFIYHYIQPIEQLCFILLV